MTELLLMLVPLFMLVFFALAMVNLLGIRPAWGPFFSLCFFMVFLTAFAIAGMADIGVVCAALFGITVIVVSLLKNGRGFKHYFRPLASPGFAFFMAAVLLQTVVHCVADTQLSGSNTDELAVWGYANKAAFYNNGVFAYAQNYSGMKIIPPGFSLVSYFFTFLHKEYFEWAAYAVYDAAVVACLSTLFQGVRRIRSLRFFGLAVVAYFIPQFFLQQTPAYATLSMAPLAGLFAGALLAVHAAPSEGKVNKTAVLAVGFTALSLVSDTGLVAGALALLVITADMAFNRARPEERLSGEDAGARRWKHVTAAVVLWAALILPSFAWYLNCLLRGVPGGVFATQPSYAEQVYSSVSEAIFNRPVFGGVNAVTVLAAVIIAFWCLSRGLTGRPKRRVGILAGFVLPVFLLYLLYVFVSVAYCEPQSSSVHPEALLYGMAAPLVPFAMLLALFAFSQDACGLAAERKRCVAMQKAVAFAMAFAIVFTFDPDVFPLTSRYSESTVKHAARLDRALYAKFLTDSSTKVYILSQGDTLHTARFYRYEFLPFAADTEVVWIKRGAEDYAQGIAELTPYGFTQILREGGYTHLLVRKPNTYLTERFGHLFDDGLSPAEAGDSKLYQIREQDGQMRLELAVH